MDHVDEQFLVRVNDSTQVMAKLVEVAERSSEEEKPFSLVSCGAAKNYLPQGTYRFHSDSIGSFESFIVPIGPEKDGGHM